MKGFTMRRVHSHEYLLPFKPRLKAALRARAQRRPNPGPLRRIELHQVEHDELASLRSRLLELILDNEQARKVSRLRLVN